MCFATITLKDEKNTFLNWKSPTGEAVVFPMTHSSNISSEL
jgi:hypothetical protein